MYNAFLSPNGRIRENVYSTDNLFIDQIVVSVVIAEEESSKEDS